MVACSSGKTYTTKIMKLFCHEQLVRTLIVIIYFAFFALGDTRDDILETILTMLSLSVIDKVTLLYIKLNVA